MTTWYIGGGTTLAGWRSTTTAPCPSSGRGLPWGGVAGGEGGSTGMDRFYRVDGLQSQAWHIEPWSRNRKPGNASRASCYSIGPPKRHAAASSEAGPFAFPPPTVQRRIDSGREPHPESALKTTGGG